MFVITSFTHFIYIYIKGHRKEDNPKESLYKETRTNGFGAEVQRRILLGTHVLTAG
jgi:aspartyl-tRNA(Asn)/glutamyl-tRNA(Gln) amidotransferase subunit A